MARPRRRFVTLAAIALASFVLAGSGVAQQFTPTLALERLFTSDEPTSAWFAPAFLDQIPLEQVANAVDQSRDGLGAFESVEPDGDRYRVVFADGFVPVIVQLDGQGRIQGLRLLPVVRPAADVAEAVDRFAELPGSFAVHVTRDGSDLASLAATDRLAVGSTFELAVLAALLDRIERGDLAWDDVVTLDPAWRSLPSGLLQDWPDGTALTLETLATLMISRSDNTTTDALIDIVGRETVEAVEGVGERRRLGHRVVLLHRDAVRSDVEGRAPAPPGRHAGRRRPRASGVRGVQGRLRAGRDEPDDAPRRRGRHDLLPVRELESPRRRGPGPVAEPVRRRPGGVANALRSGGRDGATDDGASNAVTRARAGAAPDRRIGHAGRRTRRRRGDRRPDRPRPGRTAPMRSCATPARATSWGRLSSGTERPP